MGVPLIDIHTVNYLCTLHSSTTTNNKITTKLDHTHIKNIHLKFTPLSKIEAGHRMRRCKLEGAKDSKRHYSLCLWLPIDVL